MLPRKPFASVARLPDFPNFLARAVLTAALLPIPGLATAEEPRPAAPPQGVQAMVAAYPDFLLRVEKGMLLWRDGTKMLLARLGLDREGRPLKARLKPPADPVLAATEGISAVDYEPVYLKMYGDCRTGDMRARLGPVQWSRGAPDGGQEIRAARANGVTAALQRVSDALDQLSGEAAKFPRSLVGTFNCRNVAGSNRLSLHGLGIAIDVNPTDDGYWQTAPTDAKGRPIRRSRVPMPVVEAFEREGFVWGGRWNQFDTFHFEYRPEYRIATGGPLPERLTRPEFSGFFGGRARGAAVERMSYAPRGPGALVCHRWVRQPGPNFGRCLSGTISPSGKVSAKPTVTRPAVTKGAAPRPAARQPSPPRRR